MTATKHTGYMVNIRDGQIVGSEGPEVPDGTYVCADDLPSNGGTLFHAAAPDLLAALQALSALNDNYAPFGGEIYQDRIERAWDNARAAIARATHPANPLRGED
jgi:hypothetical protein